MLKFRKIIKCLLVAVLAFSAPVVFAQYEAPPAPVVVVTAERTMLAPTVAVPGTVVSRSDSRISAEVAGRVMWIAEVGTVVETGDPLARLDSTILRLQRDEFTGVVESQRARLTFLEPEVERLIKLKSENNAAVSLLEQTQSNLQVARGDTRVAEAQLAQIEDQLARTVIRAPFSGIVSERMSSIGETLSVGSEVARLVDPVAIEVVARAPLRSASFLKRDATVNVSSPRGAESATVRTLVPFGDPQSHMFEMRLDVAPENWIVGDSVEVSIPTAEAKDVLAVPRDALVLRRNGASVFRVNEDTTVEQISVLAGQGDGELIEVSGELNAGDTVVVRGAERLRSGAKVMVLNSDDATVAGGGTPAN